MFTLRKFVTLLVLPFNFSLILIVIGFLLLFLNRKQRIGKIFIAAGILLLLLFSLPPVANHLTGSLEDRYKPLSAESIRQSNIRSIVVLGGGHNSSKPAGAQLSPSSLARLTEAIRIYRIKPGMKLILCGGPVFDPSSNAEAMAAAAKMFGIDEQNLVLETESRDTEEEAQFLAPMLKAEPFYLVTSAVHMRRSVTLFQKQGTNPVPAPTDYAFQPRQAPLALRLLPNSTAFQQSERALREYLGLLWSRLRGKAR